MTVEAYAVALACRAFGVPARSGLLLGGGASANQLIALADHSGRRRWVLRGPRRDARPARLAFLAAFHHAARARGLPVAVPRRAVDRQPWALDACGRPWLLLDYLPGRPLEVVTAAWAARAAAQLAAFHCLPEHLDLAATVTGPDTGWDAWLVAPQETWQATVEMTVGHHGLLDAYRLHLKRLHEHASGLLHAAHEVWGHGDFHGHNLLHHRGRLTGVLDLDGVGRRPRITEVAYAVLMLARTGSGDYRLQPDLVRAVLTGYQRHAASALTEAERRALWAAMVLSQLPDPAHLGALRRAGRDLGPALARPLNALRDLAAQRTRLVAVVAEGAKR